MRAAALLFLTTAMLRADDVVLTDGTIFHNATIVSHTSTTASITFADGAAMVRLDRLDAASLLKVAKQPVSDSPVPPDKPAEDSKTTADNNAAVADKAAQLAKAVVTPDAKPAPAKIDPRIIGKVDAAAIDATGKIEEVTTDGCFATLVTQIPQEKIVPHVENVSVNIVPDGLGHTPVNQIQTRKWTTTETDMVQKPLGTVFLSCSTHDLAEGSNWSGKVWKIGTYTASTGTPMYRYTAIPDEAYGYFTAHPDRIPAPMAKADDHLYDTPERTSTSLTTEPMK